MWESRIATATGPCRGSHLVHCVGGIQHRRGPVRGNRASWMRLRRRGPKHSLPLHAGRALVWVTLTWSHFHPAGQLQCPTQNYVTNPIQIDFHEGAEPNKLCARGRLLMMGWIGWRLSGFAAWMLWSRAHNMLLGCLNFWDSTLQNDWVDHGLFERSLCCMGEKVEVGKLLPAPESLLVGV